MYVGVQSCILYNQVVGWVQSEFGMDSRYGEGGKSHVRKDGELEQMLGLTVSQVQHFFQDCSDDGNEKGDIDADPDIDPNEENLIECNESTLPSVSSRRWALSKDVMNHYIDMKSEEHDAFMGRLDKQRMLERTFGPRASCYMNMDSPGGPKKSSKESNVTSTNDGSDAVEEDEEIGECIQVTSTQVPDSTESPTADSMDKTDKASDGLDRNYEITKLFKQKLTQEAQDKSRTLESSAVKKKRARPQVDDDISPLKQRRLVKSDEKEGEVDSPSKSVPPSPALNTPAKSPSISKTPKSTSGKTKKANKKEQKKKKSSKKKKKKDIFDELFDGL